MTDVARMVVGIAADTKDLERGLNRAASQVQSFGSMLLRAGGVAGIGALFTGAISSATAFSDAMAKVNSLIGDTSEVDKMSKAVRELSVQFGRASSQETDALFKIVQNGARTAAQAVDQLAASNVLARSTFSTVALAADALTTVFDAYGDAAGDAALVSDKLFAATKVGETSLADLQASLGDIAPFARSAGIGLDQLLAAVTTISSQGGGAARALTGIRAIINGLLDPSKEAAALARRLGIDFSLAGLQARGFGGFMEDIAKKTGGSTQAMSVLFGSVRELVPALRLAKDEGKVFARTLEEIAGAAGAARAASDAIGKTPGEAFRQLKEEGAEALRALGDTLLKVTLPALIALRRNLDLVALAAGGVAVAFGVAKFGAAIASAARSVLFLTSLLAAGRFVGFSHALAAMIPGLATLQASFAAATGSVEGFWLAVGFPVLGIVTALGLIGAALLLIRNNAREAREALEKLRLEAPTMTRFQLLGDINATKKHLDEIKTKIDNAFAHPGRSGVRGELIRLGLEATDAKKRLDILNAAWNKTSGLAPLTTITAPRGADAGVGLGDLAADLEKRAAILLDAERQIRDTVTLKLPTLPTELAALYDVATAAAEAHKNEVSALANKLRDVVELLRTSKLIEGQRVQSGAVAILSPKFTKLPETFKPIELPAALKIKPPTSGEIVGTLAQIQKVVDAQGILDFSKLTGDQSFVAQMTKELAATEQAFRDWAKRTAIAILQSNQPLAEKLRLIRELNATVAAAGLSDSTSKFAAGLQLAVQAGRGLLGIADGMGKIGDRARQAVGGVLDLVQAMATLAAAKGSIAGLLSGGIGAAGAVIQIGASLLGDSESEKEANRLRQENNAVVERLTQAIKGNIDALGSKGKLAQIAVDPGFREAARFGSTSETLRAFLARFGLTIAEFQAQMKALGITIWDESGRLVRGGFEAMDNALRATIKQLTQFGESFDEQKAKQSLRSEVFDIDQTPLQRFNDALDLLKTQSLALSGAFAGIDVSTTAGRDQAEAVLREFVRRLEAGSITAEEFDKFGGKDAFIQWILDADKALDDFTGAIDKAAASMLNVPKVLKVATLAFQAQRTSNPLPETAITDPGWLASRGAVSMTFAEGSIVIQDGSGDPTKHAMKFVDALKTVGRARGVHWSQVN